MTWVPKTTYAGHFAWETWAFDQVHQQHPEATVQEVSAAFGEITQKIITGVAGGTPVDASELSVVHGRDLFDKGALSALDAEIAQNTDLAPANYWDAANRYRTSNGKYFGLPIYITADGLGINSRMLREAGLDPHAADLKTWDDLVRYSDKLTKTDSTGKINQLGTPFDPPGVQEWATWSYTNGGEVQDDAVTKALFSSTPVADTLHYRATQYQRFGVNRVADWKDDQFKTQRQAFQWTDIVGFYGLMIGGIYVPKDFEYWYIAPPKGPSGSASVSSAWANMVGRPTGVKSADLSFTLLHFLAGTAGTNQLFKNMGWFPPLKTFYQSADWTAAVKGNPILAQAPAEINSGKEFAFFRRYSDVGKILTPLLTDAVTGKRDVQQSLSDGAQQVGAILST